MLGSAVSRSLVPEQVARWSLPYSRTERGFWLPNTALMRGTRGLWSVYVVNENQRVARRDVEMLYTGGESSFIRGTLTDGETVIVDGVHRLVPGQRVESLSAEAALPTLELAE